MLFVQYVLYTYDGNQMGDITYSIFYLVAPYNATITEVVVINMVTYTCYADGGPGNTYEWLRLRNSLVVSSIQELILDNTDPLDGGVYQCTITNDAGNTIVMTTLNGEDTFVLVLIVGFLPYSGCSDSGCSTDTECHSWRVIHVNMQCYRFSSS